MSKNNVISIVIMALFQEFYKPYHKCPIYSLFLRAKYSMQNICKLARPHLETLTRFPNILFILTIHPFSIQQTLPIRNFRSRVDIFRLQHRRYHFIKRTVFHDPSFSSLKKKLLCTHFSATI